jgi:hypothetical protein
MSGSIRNTTRDDAAFRASVHRQAPYDLAALKVDHPFLRWEAARGYMEQLRENSRNAARSSWSRVDVLLRLLSVAENSGSWAATQADMQEVALQMLAQAC